MNLKPSLTAVKKELNALRKYEVVLFGSYVTGGFTPRSDIDVAVITRKIDPQENARVWRQLLGCVQERFHLQVFELLPLQLKAGIMDHRIVVFGDRQEISEYFYHFRKLWKDVKYRYDENQFSGFEEKRKRLLATIG